MQYETSQLRGQRIRLRDLFKRLLELDLKWEIGPTGAIRTVDRPELCGRGWGRCPIAAAYPEVTNGDAPRMHLLVAYAADDDFEFVRSYDTSNIAELRELLLDATIRKVVAE